MLDKRLLRLARTHRWAFALTVGCGLLGSLWLIGQALLVSQIIAGVFVRHQPLRAVTPLMLALLGMIVARAGCVWGGEIAANQLASGVKVTLRARLITHLMRLGPAFTRDQRSGELATTAVAGVEGLDDYISQLLPQVVLAAFVPLVILAIIFPLDPLSGLTLALTAPMVPILMALIGSMSGAVAQQQWTALTKMNAHFLDMLQGLTTLKLLGRSHRQAQVIMQISDTLRRATMRVLRLTFLSSLALELLATISTAIVAVEVGLRLLYGNIPFDRAFFVLLLAPEFYLPLRQLGQRYHAAQTGTAAAERIFAVLDTAVAPDDGSEIIQQGTIRFAEVHYVYPNAERPALTGVNVTIQPGSTVALVGASGAGKSTIMHLLLRFMEPSDGAIFVDDVPLQELAAEQWRAQIAWVPQRPYLFNDTVAANIRLGRSTATMAAVIAAAQAANAAAFIDVLPQGYDTVIGERGARLSGGQAQRLAIARAFVRDAPILLLDEATAHLDDANATLVHDAIAHLCRNRTVLMIAHDLDSARQADQIIVLAAGAIVGAGTHAALLAKNGHYQQLCLAGGVA